MCELLGQLHLEPVFDTLKYYILVLLLAENIFGFRSIIVLLVAVRPLTLLLRFSFFRDLAVALFVVFNLNINIQPKNDRY